MTLLSATLLFATLASAQTSNITTTAWLTNYANSNKYGYIASVVAADAQHMTLLMDYAPGTDTEALHIGGAANYTLGPSGYTIRQSMRVALPSDLGDSALEIGCSRPAQTTDDVTCSGVVGDGYARYVSCNEYQATQVGRTEASTETFVYTHTYGTGYWGEGGTETIRQDFTWPADTVTTTPAWCTSDEVPASELSRSYTTTAGDFAVYQVVIYAGQENLSAYQGGEALTTASGSTASVPAATGESGSSVASATTTAPAESTGVAGKINAVVPALAGMGLAAVAGLL